MQEGTTAKRSKKKKSTSDVSKYTFQGDRSIVFDLNKPRKKKGVADAALAKSTEETADDADNEQDQGFNAELFGKMVQRGFKRLHGSKTLSDITLVLNKEKIPCHRMVLCAWSDTFRAMLNIDSAWAEASMKELPIELENEKAHTNFKHMLSYMYTGETNFIHGHNILDIISMSNYYGIESLKELCGEILGDLVDDDNLLFFLDVVDTYDVKQLEAACGEHLAENFGELLDEGRLDELEPTTWAEMLRSDNIEIQSEEQLFEAVMSYSDQFANEVVKESGESRRDQVLTLLLPFVRWPFMSPKYLVNVIEKDSSLTHLPIVHDLMHEAFRYKVYPDIFSKTVRMRARMGFRFDKSRCHNNISLTDEDRRAFLATAGGWMNVVCVEEMSRYQNYIEWKVESGNMMLGAVIGGCSTTGYAGQWANGWTYYSPGGQVYHQNGTPATGTSYTQGDSIGTPFLAKGFCVVFSHKTFYPKRNEFQFRHRNFNVV
eukprot:TRINITY_DN51_c0_g1_i1.p1 TRINITY_DN51_c0_g1~~TRINITY_DN51_c0_g1_i1.p1  ORF type:complete len:488 (-),score=75.26 TRINITY_DN51_c0_g1_i1:370-1833(-)